MNNFNLSLEGWTTKDFLDMSTRQEWALRLGISEKTIARYEKEIIDAVDGSLLKASYWRGRRGKQKLDYYQKFILWIVTRMSTSKPRLTYEHIWQWFEEIDSHTGKKRILSMKPKHIRTVLQEG